MLNDQGVTAQGDQCGCQAGFQRLQDGIVLGPEYRGHQHRCKTVNSQPFQSRHGFPPAMKKAVPGRRGGNQIRGKQV